MTKEALKLALEALEEAWYHVGTFQPTEKAIDLYDEARAAIKEALAQPKQCQCPNCKVILHASDCAVHNEPAYPAEGCDCGAKPQQEPVAYGTWDTMLGKGNRMMMVRLDKGQDGCTVPLYTTPPQRTWVGLTDEEKHEIRYSHMTSAEFIEFIEAKLKEKNNG